MRASLHGGKPRGLLLLLAGVQAEVQGPRPGPAAYRRQPWPRSASITRRHPMSRHCLLKAHTRAQEDVSLH